LGAPAKLKNLHGKIGRRVDLARVRYGTMQSERRRIVELVEGFDKKPDFGLSTFGNI
jgi:hypothetical protein